MILIFLSDKNVVVMHNPLPTDEFQTSETIKHHVEDEICAYDATLFFQFSTMAGYKAVKASEE